MVMINGKLILSFFFSSFQSLEIGYASQSAYLFSFLTSTAFFVCCSKQPVSLTFFLLVCGSLLGIYKNVVKQIFKDLLAQY